MTKNIFVLLVFIAATFTAAGQELKENIFLNRKYWESKPTIEEVKQKIEEGNSPTELNAYAFDATVYAILANTPLQTINYLLDIPGNEVSKITHDGRNYLLWAAYKGNLELMKNLIKRGSDKLLVDDHGYELLTFTAVGGVQDTELYDYLFEIGIDVNNTNRSGAGVLHLLALKISDLEIIDYFVNKGLDIKSLDNNGTNVYMYACRMGNTELMDKLVQMGIDAKAYNDKGENAISYAAMGWRSHVNTLEFFSMLSQNGIEADVSSLEGKTPLHNLAYRAEDPKLINFFLEKGVNPNQIDEDGNTALMNAARYQNDIFIKEVLPHCRNINHQNKEGLSALSNTVRSCNKDHFDLLVKEGANPNIIDNSGQDLITHLFLNFRNRNQESFDLFYNYALTNNKMINGERNAAGSSLLHIAVEKKSAHLIEKALELNCDINALNKDGLTPLHLAAMTVKSEELLSLLVDAGADTNIRTDFDESAMDLAMENELLESSEKELKKLFNN